MRKTILASESSSIYLLGICAGTLLALFASLILTRVSAGFGGMSVQDWVSYVIMQVGFIATSFIYARVRRVDEFAVARIRKPRSVKQLILTPFIAIATILVFLPLANLWTAFLDLIHVSASVSTPVRGDVGAYFLSLIIMAALPAFGEELLMRGNVFHGLSTRNIWFGILMSALFFSLMHANPAQTVHQFGLGIVLALVMTLSGSLWACVLVHFFNNFISLTLTSFMPQVDVIYYRLGYFNWLTGAASVIVGLFILISLLYAMYRMGDKKEGGNFRIVDDGIVYDEFTLLTAVPTGKCHFVKDFFSFIKSLFTANGWRRLTRVLAGKNEIECVGKAQSMIGVWIALAIVIAYWLFAFIASLPFFSGSGLL
ncbi:MAG: CPBP family intramembrane metalloprotease [Clostridia bacterium]|nr:CPBP family intramembrane metalloprotease [Clostridia bacterium]